MFQVEIVNFGILSSLQLSNFNVNKVVEHCYVRNVVKSFRLREALNGFGFKL